MQRLLLTCLCLFAGCSSETEQLAAVKRLRSATAEWALVNREAVRQHLPAVYVNGMRHAAREQIQTAAASLRDPNSEAAREADAVQALPDDAPSDLLSRHAAALKAIESQLESA